MPSNGNLFAWGGATSVLESHHVGSSPEPTQIPPPPQATGQFVGGTLTMGKTSSQEEPLVVSGHFNYSREPKDRFWGYLYALFLAFTVIGGIVTIKSR